MEFAPARESDLPVLERWQPTGLSRTHARRYARQVDGASTYLIAWSDAPGGEPIGSCEIRWDGCAAAEVTARCPELNGLQVWPESRQGQGIGTAIIAEVERIVAARGLPAVGLGVDDSNVRAEALYRRLGYRDVGMPYLDRYFYVEADGGREDVVDHCRFLVKDLVARPRPASAE